MRSARLLQIWVVLAPLTATAPALAYRPFDGTDAAVAEKGEFELELGVGYYALGSERDLVFPAAILNYGIIQRVELVLAGFNFVGLDPATPAARDRLLDTGFFAKVVLREGCLQENTGLSVATEFGILLPQLGGERGLGAAGGVIVSKCFERAVAVHLNLEAQMTRQRNLDLFGGLILEGPLDSAVRPVAELFVEREFAVTTTYSALAGLIWAARGNLDTDIALRVAATMNAGLPGSSLGTVFEFRLGFTWRYET